MGYEIQKDETYPLLESNLSTEKVGRIPIMAHPPELESDLTMQDFLMKASNSKDSNKKILKHIKLDFKEMDTVEPTIAAIGNGDANPQGIIISSIQTFQQQRCGTDCF